MRQLLIDDQRIFVIITDLFMKNNNNSDIGSDYELYEPFQLQELNYLYSLIFLLFLYFLFK